MIYYEHTCISWHAYTDGGSNSGSGDVGLLLSI